MDETFKLINRWLTDRQLAKNTKRIYRLEAERFFAWLHIQDLSISSCSKEHVETYFKVLQHEPNDPRSGFLVRRRKALTLRSLEQTRRILHTFFDWAIKGEHVQRNPMWGIVAKQHAYAYPTKTGIERDLRGVLPRILKLNLESSENAEELRLATIVHLAFWVGASTSEIALLKVDDFRTTPNAAYIGLYYKKNSKRVEIELPKETRDLILRYLDIRRIRTSANDMGDRALVASLRSDACLSGWTICNEVRKWKSRTKQKDNKFYGGLRSIRRNFIKLAIENGLQELTISDHLRCQRVALPNIARKKFRTSELYSSIKGSL